MLRRIKNLILHRQPAVNNLTAGPWLKRAKSSGSAPVEFSPADLFASGEEGAWYDPSDFSTMFQDSAGTTPVTAAGQPVGKILDKSGRGNHATQATAGSRPTLIQDADGIYGLSFNGSSQSMVTGNVDFAATTKVTTFLGLFKDTQAQTVGMLVQLSSNLTTNPGSFALAADGYNATDSSHGAALRGSASVGQNNPANAAVPPKTFVSSVLYDWNGASVGAQMAMRVDKVAQTPVGTFTSTAVDACANRPIYIGYNGTNQWFKGTLYSVIVRGATSSGQEISDTEDWVIDKMTPAPSSFTPADLFASGEEGAWYDPSDFATMWQDSTGDAPVTAVGQPVGLILDKSKGLAVSAEKLTSPNFDSATGWTLSAGFTISGGNLSINASSGNAQNAFLGLAGKTYSVTIDVVSLAGGTIAVAIANSSNEITSAGVKTFTAYGAANNYLFIIVSTGTPNAVIASVSVKEIAGNHAAQITAAARPALANNANTKPYRNFDAVDDSMSATFASSLGSTCTVARSDPVTGASILTAQTIGTGYSASADDCALIITNDALTPQETSDLTAWLNERAGI